MSSEKLEQIYAAIAESAGCVVEDGLLTSVLGGERDPVMIDGKRAALPTKEILANPDRTNLHVIHWLAEHLTRVTPTQAVNKLVGLMNSRLDYCLAILAYELLRVAASPAQNNKLNPVQNEFLSRVPDASEKTLETLSKLFEAPPVDGVYKTNVAFYIKRNGTHKGESYKRVAVVSFPLYEELRDNKKKVLNVTISEKDRVTIMRLFEYMIPGIETPDAYNYGSNSDVAPIMDAVVHGFAGITGSINELVSTFKNILNNPDELHIRDDWMDEFDDMSWVAKEVRKIPRQGAAIDPDDETAQPMQSQVKHNPAQSNPLPWENAGNIPVQPAQPQQQTTGYGQPVYAAPQQPQQPQTVVKTTERGGLDFAALARSRPDQFSQPSVYNGPQALQAQRPSYYDKHGHRPQAPMTGYQSNYSGYGNNGPRRFST
jgi:hypothetical protein